MNQTLSYDANGNVTAIDAASGLDRSFTYDGRNHATRVTLGNPSNPEAEDQFLYAPDGSRYYRKSTWKESGNTKTSYTLYEIGVRWRR